jgi:hypothetical protein
MTASGAIGRAGAKPGATIVAAGRARPATGRDGPAMAIYKDGPIVRATGTGRARDVARAAMGRS